MRESEIYAPPVGATETKGLPILKMYIDTICTIYSPHKNAQNIQIKVLHIDYIQNYILFINKLPGRSYSPTTVVNQLIILINMTRYLKIRGVKTKERNVTTKT